MDFQDLPDMNLSEKEKRKLHQLLRKSYVESKQSHEEWVQRMRKKGYSDDEINLIMLM